MIMDFDTRLAHPGRDPSNNAGMGDTNELCTFAGDIPKGWS